MALRMRELMIMGHRTAAGAFAFGGHLTHIGMVAAGNGGFGMSGKDADFALSGFAAFGTRRGGCGHGGY